MTNERLFFFEQTDFSLRFARCLISETSLHIEELKEVSIHDTEALTQLAPAGTQVVCALRPKPRQLYLSTPDDAKRHAGLTGLQQFARLPLFAKSEPAWFAGAEASDGAAPTATPWLLSMSSEAAQLQARATFETIKLKPARCLDAAIATVGAIASALTGPTLVLEIGELASHALLVTHEGLLSAGTVKLNLDQIAEAVQAELNLKFRGSAAKLFFNPDCDFSEAGQKIAVRLGAVLKADLTPLLAGRPAPVALYCAGLPAAQQWLALQLSAVLGYAPCLPAVQSWSLASGVTFATPALEASVSPSWFNFLHFINAQTLDSPGGVAWQAEWISLKAPVGARPATTPPMPGQTRSGRSASTPPIPLTAPAPTAPPGKAIAGVGTPVPATPAPAAKGTPAPTPSPAKPTSGANTPLAAAVAPAGKSTPAPATTPAKPASPPPASNKPGATPAPAAKSTSASLSYPPKPEAKKPAEPIHAKSPAPSPVSTPWASADEPAPKSKMPLFIGIGVLILALLGGGNFYLQSQKEETARIALEKQQTEQRLKAAEEKARLDEQKARSEAENRKKFEFETSQKLAQSEAARQQAETEARNQAATRLANARGTLVVTTQPAGASVTVADLPPQSSPATFTYLKIGRYPVTITLAHYESVNLELEVKENETTESGAVALVSVAGSIELATDPAGANYELHPASSMALSLNARRTGITPAKLDDLDPGDYSVTFSRPGWAPHTETVSVNRNATARTAWAFPSGAVKITSNPSGATVTREGVKLGVTPLTLSQPAGPARYELSLKGYDPVTLPGVVEKGSTVELSAQLPVTEHPFGPGELDTNPEPINPKPPDLPPNLTLVDGRIVVQMTVNRDGSTTDIKIVRVSNPEISKFYLAALAKWKFKPGTIAGKPVRSIVVVPFLITATGY